MSAAALARCILCWCFTWLPVQAQRRTIDAVVLSHLNNQAFNLSISSALKYLIDVNTIYVIAQDQKLEDKFGSYFGSRVRFVSESNFPWTSRHVQRVLYEAVKLKNPNYPLTGSSEFEKWIEERSGWYLQQLMKLHAGEVLGLRDYVVLDADLCWFKPIAFIANQSGDFLTYYYTPSNQQHSSYYRTMKSILQIEPKLTSTNIHYSGISHHMVFSKHVLQSLRDRVKELHHGRSFWHVVLVASALEMTSQAPSPKIVGAGNVFSEYELYFHYALQYFPNTVRIRHLMWANGPRPGLVYSPPKGSTDLSDYEKKNYLSLESAEGSLEKQSFIDRWKGYDYVGYHSYARRRYFELPDDAVKQFCWDKRAPPSSDCGYRGFIESGVHPQEWFSNCVCFNLH